MNKPYKEQLQAWLKRREEVYHIIHSGEETIRTLAVKWELSTQQIYNLLRKSEKDHETAKTNKKE